MLGTLSDVMGMVVKVPELTEMSSMEQVIHVLIHSSNNGVAMVPSSVLDTQIRKRVDIYLWKQEILTLSAESWETLFLNA